MAHPAISLFQQPERIVAGLMSGTSLDGVDAVLVRLRGSGRALDLETLAFVSRAYDSALREALGRVVEADTSDVRLVSQLHVRLAHAFADTVKAALQEARLKAAHLDRVGSHGQTVQHVPDAEPAGGAPTRSTLQLGCPATLAVQLGTPVVSDFRAADMALGGQGAPLVPYLDDALFSSAEETRGLLNLGGIANLTLLPKGSGPEATVAFDTGPANMLMDALAQRLFGQPYDADGVLAAQGTADDALVDRLLAEDYFQRTPPKSTGRELFGAAYVERLLGEGPTDPHDLLATATALTARSIHDAYVRFLAPTMSVDRLLASGGGVRNAELMRHLAKQFTPIPVETTAAHGLDPNAKEAVLFAVLAHEWANGIPTNVPSVTGASRPSLLGSLTLP